MLDFDVIESQFRAAVRVMPKLVRPSVRRVLVVTDLEPEPAAGLGAQVQGFLRVLDGAEYVTLARGDYYGIRGLLGKLEAERPDLIVTFRSLFEAEKDLPHTIEYIDLAAKPAWFLEISPHGRVPLLQVDDAVLFESLAIASVKIGLHLGQTGGGCFEGDGHLRFEFGGAAATMVGQLFVLAFEGLDLLAGGLEFGLQRGGRGSRGLEFADTLEGLDQLRLASAGLGL